MAELSMNSFSDKLTNFKIKPIEGMTRIQLSNKSVYFKVETDEEEYQRTYEFKDIRYDEESDTIDIILE